MPDQDVDLTPGNTFQAADAGLLSIAGLTTAADQMIYTTGSNTYAVTPLTSAGRALIDDSDAAAQRTTLGLGSIATQASSSVSITGGKITGITDMAVADGGTGASTLTDGGILLGSGTGAITPMAVLAKGSIVVGDGVTDPVALAVGTNGQVLTADSAEASGVKWATGGGAGGRQAEEGCAVSFNQGQIYGTGGTRHISDGGYARARPGADRGGDCRRPKGS